MRTICVRCEGSGYTGYQYFDNYSGNIEDTFNTCPICHGKGDISEERANKLAIRFVHKLGRDTYRFNLAARGKL